MFIYSQLCLLCTVILFSVRYQHFPCLLYNLLFFIPVYSYIYSYIHIYIHTYLQTLVSFFFLFFILIQYTMWTTDGSSGSSFFSMAVVTVEGPGTASVVVEEVVPEMEKVDEESQEREVKKVQPSKRGSKLLACENVDHCFKNSGSVSTRQKSTVEAESDNPAKYNIDYLLMQHVKQELEKLSTPAQSHHPHRHLHHHPHRPHQHSLLLPHHYHPPHHHHHQPVLHILRSPSSSNTRPQSNQNITGPISSHVLPSHLPASIPPHLPSSSPRLRPPSHALISNSLISTFGVFPNPDQPSSSLGRGPSASLGRCGTRWGSGVHSRIVHNIGSLQHRPGSPPNTQESFPAPVFSEDGDNTQRPEEHANNSISNASSSSTNLPSQLPRGSFRLLLRPRRGQGGSLMTQKTYHPSRRYDQIVSLCEAAAEHIKNFHFKVNKYFREVVRMYCVS
ncbi:hypothetical protein E2C01_010580 [Portunus trituberculatus]|uniref:Uncharacterized protein n=1 Tax=Portunus trituberculatus TaxID=210409 RepID=A0A5B7D918_PORTR|nr:hypothetical protein [Portunus trituberculatus]